MYRTEPQTGTFSQYLFLAQPYQKQEIDHLEELNGAWSGYEIKWGEKRLRVPSGFSAAYPECPVALINRENMTEFVTD